MNKLFGISALLIAVSIACGAFAAHGLKDKLDPYYLGIFEKAAYYQLTQGLGLFCITLLGRTEALPGPFIITIFWILFAGIAIFSGSLFILALTQIKWLGAITPIGGALMILAWIWLGIKLLTS
jgi:uncharacterized membrane protein YgdD (TMEM256/DUF423 family)